MQETENMKSYVDEYESWIHKKIPIDDDWIEEINVLSFTRDEIHAQFEADDKLRSSSLANKVRELDCLWQGQISATKNSQFVYVDKPEKEYPDSHWWWNIDRLEELSDESKSTL